MKKKRVGLLFGGVSGEHEIAILSARSIFYELSSLGHYDVVPVYLDQGFGWWTGEGITQVLEGHNLDLTCSSAVSLHFGTPGNLWAESSSLELDLILPVLHGTYGEDGSIQGLLELLQLPYVGCGVQASSLAMDKVTTKRVLSYEGVPQTPWLELLHHDVSSYESEAKAIWEQLTPPLFVKPANLGSSVGISKVTSYEELIPALKLAFTYDTTVVVEQGVLQPRELEVGMLGLGLEVQLSEPGEQSVAADFYSFEAKYMHPGEEGPTIPAKISQSVRDQCLVWAKTAVRCLRLEGLSRIDFLLGDDGQLVLNEVNTFPGFTQVSMYPLLAQSLGYSYAEVLERLLNFAEKRFATRQQLETQNKSGLSI